MSNKVLRLPLILVLAALGCGDDSDPTPVGADMGVRSQADAATAEDAGELNDAGDLNDAGQEPDAGRPTSCPDQISPNTVCVVVDSRVVLFENMRLSPSGLAEGTVGDNRTLNLRIRHTPLAGIAEIPVGTHVCETGSGLEVLYWEQVVGQPSTTFSADASQGACRMEVSEGGEIGVDGPFKGEITASLISQGIGMVEISSGRFHYE